MNTKFTKLCGAILSALLTFSFFTAANPAYAVERDQEVPVSGITEQELKAIENEVRFIFEEASTFENGVLTIDRDLLQDTYGEELGSYVALGIEELYTNDNLAEEIRANAEDRSFWSCMKGEVVGLIPGVDLYQLLTSGDLKAYVEGKAWGKVAALLGEQLVKLGVKTNVAGIIASLAIGAGKCAIWG